MQNFSHVFGHDKHSKNVDSLRGVFSTGQRGNDFFGDSGIISQTWKSLRLVLNKSADLIQRLMTAVRQLFVQNRELKSQLSKQNQEFRAQLNAKEMERVQAQADAFQAREFAKRADLIIRSMSDEKPSKLMQRMKYALKSVMLM